MTHIRRLLLPLSTGYILLFFSEHLFWARARPGDTLANWAATWLAYSLLAFVFLSAVRHFRVRSLEALFVAGALVGWLGEGVLVQTLYDHFPLQISWTGLGWHALISVCLGWYGLRRTLQAPKPGGALGLCLGFGAFWGGWAVFWRIEEPASMTPVPDLAAFVFATTALLALSLWLYEWAGPQAFSPSRPAILGALILLLAIFSLGTVPAAPMAVVVLPLLLGLVLLALSRNRSRETRPDLLAAPGRPPPPVRYLLLAALPVAATLVYALAVALDLRWHTNWLVYLITMPAGFALFALAWIRLVRRPPAAG